MKKYLIILWVFNCTEFTIPTELSGKPHVSVLRMLILRLRQYPQFVFCTKRYFLFTGCSTNVLKVKLNLMFHIKNRFKGGKEKFSEIWRMDDIELCLDKLTIRNVRLKLLKGPIRLGHLLYLQTDILYFSKGSYCNAKSGNLKVRNGMKEITKRYSNNIQTQIMDPVLL